MLINPIPPPYNVTQNVLIRDVPAILVSIDYVSAGAEITMCSIPTKDDSTLHLLFKVGCRPDQYVTDVHVNIFPQDGGWNIRYWVLLTD